MKILICFAALVFHVTVNGQAVFQQSAYPLSGFLQPLTYQAVPNAFQQQQQQQAVQQSAPQQGLVIQQQPSYQNQALQQQQPVQQQQSATSSNVQEANYAAYQQQQQPTIATAAAVQQKQPATYAGPSAVVNNVNADGTYSFGYQTPDGQMRAEAVQADGTTRGSYTYRTPEGQLVTINYTAGKHGFQTSPGTSITSDVSTAQAAAPATASAPATSSNPTLIPVSGTTSSGTPFVIYSNVPQTGFQSYYPFTGVIAQPETAIAAEQQVGATAGQPQGNQGQQSQATSAVAPAQTPSIRAPAGFSYGSNPQAIQQLQRLLLV